MNKFLARFAVKHMQIGYSRTWVITVETENNSKKPVAAYYTLAHATVERQQIPVKKSLPSYPIPVILIARLAVAKDFQGKGLGAKLLVTALRKSVELTNTGLPSFAVILDVLNESALEFYKTFEVFEPFTDDPMRLFIPMTVAREI